MSLPWSQNKFFSTWINSSNNVSGTYGNVSLRVDGNTQLSNSTITALGVNKNSGATYALDVSGNSYATTYFMSSTQSITDNYQLTSKLYVDSNIIPSTTKSKLTDVATVATSGTSYNWTYGSAQNIVFTGTTAQIFNLPIVSSAANLGTTITIYRTATSDMTVNPATGYSLYDFNNAVLTTRPLNTADRCITITAISTGTTQWQMTSQSPNSVITAILSQSQTFSGQKTFTLAPVMSGASITAATIPTSALVGSFVDTTTNQSVGGIKTFTSPPVMSGASISSGTIPSSALAGGFVDTTTNQSVGGIKTFTSPPVMSGASITAATIPTSALAGGFVDTTTTQTVGGSKTFTGASIFNNTVLINNLLSINTANQVTFYNSAIPTVGYVSHDFTLNVYTNTMLNSNFTKNVGIQNGNIDNFTAVNLAAFTGALPTYSGASPVYANNTFFPRSYGDTRYSQLAATNIFSGTTNTFQNSLIANNFIPSFPLTNTSLRMGLNSMQYATSSAIGNLAFGQNTIQGDSVTPANNTGSKNTVIGYNAGVSLTKNSSISPDDNVIIGYTAGQNLSKAGNANSGPAYKNVIIGSNCGQNYYIQKSVLIGADVASTGTQFLSDSTIVGYNSGVSLNNVSGVSIFGSSNLPSYNGNGGQAFGCQLGTFALNNDQGLFCGINSGASINTGWGSCFVGGQVGNNIYDGGGCFFGGIAVDTTKTDIVNSVAIGSFFNVDDDDTFKIGGYNIITGAYQNLLIGNKNRILFNTNVSTATQALTFEMGEHINVFTGTTTNITLPVPENKSIGSRFTIVKSYSSAPVAITITASSGLTIYSSSSNTNTYSFSASEYYLTLICINTSGTAWIVSNQDTSKQFVNLTTSQSIQGVKNFQDTTGSPAVTTTRLETINDSVSNNPNLNFLHTKSTAQVANDTCGLISFDMKNSTTGVTTRYGNMNCYVSSGTVGAESSIVAITGKQAGADLSYLNLGGGISAFTNPLRVTNYWPSTAFNTLITTTTTLSYTASNSFYKYYSVSAAATAYTITLPTIDAGHLGNEIQFRRVAGTTTTVLSFIGNGSQNVYNTALTGGLTAQALMASGVYIVRLVPMLLTNTPTYAWFQM